MGIIWEEGNRFELNGIRFQFIGELRELFALKEEDGLVLGKWRRVLDAYIDAMSGLSPQNIFELGIFRGGSAAFFNEWLSPEKLVAIDYMQAPTDGFKAYLESAPNAGRIRPYFGIDQADKQKLGSICRREFGDALLDLVIDDASHLLDKTKTSFNFLFPRVKPGGLYVIEDWSWAHMDDPDGVFRQRFHAEPAMSNLVIEIMLASARRPDLIPEVRVFPSCAFIRRGEGETGEDFDISRESFHRGLPIGGSDLFDR